MQLDSRVSGPSSAPAIISSGATTMRSEQIGRDVGQRASHNR
jgi:hypothetical protein